jgi:hypothetical protein
MFGQIEPPVQGCHERRRLPGQQRKRVVIEVAMQNVEITGAPADALQHRHVQRVRIAHRAVEAQRARPYGIKLRRRH